MIRSLQSPQEVSCDGVDQTRTLCQSKTHRNTKRFLSQHGVRTVYFISISRLTFGSTDDQAKFCTHRHTYNFLVVACQNSSWCRVVAFKTDTRSQKNSAKSIQNFYKVTGAITEPPWWRFLIIVMQMRSCLLMIIKPFDFPSHVTWLMMARVRVSEGSFSAAKHKYRFNHCAAVALSQTPKGEWAIIIALCFLNTGAANWCN